MLELIFVWQTLGPHHCNWKQMLTGKTHTHTYTQMVYFLPPYLFPSLYFCQLHSVEGVKSKEPENIY